MVIDRIDAMLARIESAVYAMFRRKETFYLVERVSCIGWFILSRHDQYLSAYEAQVLLPVDQRLYTRVLTKTEWERRTVALMATRDPWLAIGALQADLQRARSELDDLKAINNSGAIALYADPMKRDA